MTEKPCVLSFILMACIYMNIYEHFSYTIILYIYSYIFLPTWALKSHMNSLGFGNLLFHRLNKIYCSLI